MGITPLSDRMKAMACVLGLTLGIAGAQGFFQKLAPRLKTILKMPGLDVPVAPPLPAVAPPVRGTLSGRVQRQGNPCPGLEVELWSQREWGAGASTEDAFQKTSTDAAGAYRFEGLLPGPYLLRAPGVPERLVTLPEDAGLVGVDLSPD